MTDPLPDDVLACSGDFACLAIDHIEGCFATDTTGYGLSSRIAALLAVARGHARLTAENDLLRRRVEIQTEVGIGQEKYADRLTAENDRLRNDIAVLADRLIPGGPR